MALDREAIYVALLERLAAVQGFAIPPSRRYRDPDSVAPGEMPCAFLVAGDELAERRRDVPTKWTLSPTIYIHAKTKDPIDAPGSVLVPLVTAIEKAIEYRGGDGVGVPGAAGTLGQLVAHCWMTSVEYVEGSDSGQGSAWIDLEILAVSEP